MGYIKEKFCCIYLKKTIKINQFYTLLNTTFIFVIQKCTTFLIFLTIRLNPILFSVYTQSRPQAQGIACMQTVFSTYQNTTNDVMTSSEL